MNYETVPRDLNYFEIWFSSSTFPTYGNWKSIVKNKVREWESRLWLEFCSGHPNMHVAQACIENVSPSKFWSLAYLYSDMVSCLHIQINNKKRSHTQLDSRKQVIAFQDRVITINIKEAQHPLK